MADSIVRLVVNSSEYDQKLKRAAEGLTRYADECRKVGGTLEVVEKDTLDYVRALGQMDAVSRTATGKLSEMKKTFTELSVVYKNMTDEEKNSPFGKALVTSLDQLKGRIQDSKSQLDGINKSINGGGGLTGALDSLSEKFGMSVQSLAGWGTALAAGKAALDVAKDAFFASESSVDEWGRTVAASQSLYEGFLTAINNGDISGYLSNIDSIVKAARLAYDELDKLGTMKTIQAPQISKQQTENERIRSMIQTGRYIAPQDGRKNAVFNGREMQNGDKLTAGQIRALEKQLQGGMQKVVKLVGNEVDQTGKAINAYYDKLAKTNGMSLQEFKKGTSSWEEFTKRMQGYEQYKEWDKQARTEFAKQGGRGNVDFDKSNPYAEFRKWGTFRVDKEGDNSYKDLVALIQQRDQQAGQAYSMQSQVYRTMNRADGVTLRQIMGGGSGGSSSGSVGGRSGGSGGGNSSEPTYAADSIAAQQKLVSELTRQWTEAGASVRNDYIQPLIEAETKLKEMKDEQALLKEQAQGKLKGGEVETPVVADVSSSIYTSIDEIRNELAENPIVIPIESTEKDVKAIAKAASITADVVGSIGDAFNAIEDPAGKVMGTVMQSIASVALGYAQATVAAAQTGNPWVWAAFAISGLATMMSMISSIHSATGYAQGGIVEGNSYSGDNMMFGGDGLYGLNAGEVVLTKAQQNTLAQTLEGNGLGNINVTGRLNGTDILLSADRAAQASGRGQLVTWK